MSGCVVVAGVVVADVVVGVVVVVVDVVVVEAGSSRQSGLLVVTEIPN